MKIIGYCDYILNTPVPASYFAERINIALLGWAGEFYAVAVCSVLHNKAGLVFINVHPTAEIEGQCQQYYDEELDKDKAELEAEWEEDFNEDNLT